MLRVFSRCGAVFLVLLLSHFGSAFPQEDLSLELEPILVSKKKVHLIRPLEITAEDLTSSFMQALRSLPLDVESRSAAGDIQADLSLRGSTFQAVSVLVDGQRINDPQTAHHNLDLPLTKADIKRIELIPGLGSSLSGPDSLGGAVNFLVKKPQQSEGLLECGIGQNQNGWGLLSVSNRQETLATRFSVERAESAGFRYDTDFKKLTATLVSSLDIGEADWDVLFGYQEKEFGAYDFYTPSLGYPSKEWTKTYLFTTGLTLEKAAFIIKPGFLWRRHFDKFMLDKTEMRSRYLNHHRTDMFAPNIYFQVDDCPLGRPGIGLGYNAERIRSVNLGRHSRNYKSLSLDDSLDLTPAFSMGLSWRLDDFNTFREYQTGSAGLRYSVNEDSQLHWSVSKSIRIPCFTELYYSDPTTVGNSNLVPESAWNYETGFDYQAKEMCLGATAFFRDEKNLIDWVVPASGQLPWEAQNIAEAAVCGIENYLKYELSDGLDADISYTYIDKRINGRGYLYKYGPSYMRHMAKLGLNLRLPFGKQALTLAYKKKPHRDGWFILDMGLSLSLNKNTQFFTYITNLLNVEYQELEGIAQPGRSNELGMRIQW